MEVLPAMYVIKDGAIRISVRNLVEFVYNSGDIDNRTGSMADVERMQEGARLHRVIQKKAGAGYMPEVLLKLDVPVEHENSYVIMIEGRADGIIQSDGGKASDVCIDEIKTVTGNVDRIEQPVYVHKAQAMCYAYIYASLQGLARIRVRMTYCSVDDEQIKYFYEEFCFDELEQWFQGLINDFARWTDFVFEQKKLRDASTAGLKFPFCYRKGQKELAASVYRACRAGKNLYIQAPTGTGKTISTIYPSVMAVGGGLADRIFYLTAKTVTRAAAEDTYNILRRGGLHFRTITLTARDKVCILEKRECNPDGCPYAAGHYDRVNEAVYDIITHEISIDRNIVAKYADIHRVCPFELSLDVSVWCDGIICDYNYAFDPNVRLKRFFADGEKGGYIFLVDEAHNLVDRGRSMYSASLAKEDFLEIKRLIKETDRRLYSSLERCNKDLLELKKECDTYNIHSDISGLALHIERAYSLMRKFIDNNKGFGHSDRFMEFFLAVRHFLNMYELLSDKYVIYSENDSDGKFYIHLFCVDPSDNLKECVNTGVSSVFFSATLLPVRYYKEMITGDAGEMAVYASSCFDEARRGILVGRDVSSRYTRRSESEFRRIAEYIACVAGAKRGNYMVFFPSYSFMKAVYDIIKIMAESGEFPGGLADMIMCQEPSLDEAGREEFLAGFTYDSAVIGFCVLGGIFSEGIDLKNDSLIGAVIVGTGLPMVCTVQTILKDYYDSMGKNGFEYAYIYPGMNKVMQAAGRVIRTEEDRGVIALLDERFLRSEYLSVFPREWKNYKVVTLACAGEAAKSFWEDGLR